MDHWSNDFATEMINPIYYYWMPILHHAYKRDSKVIAVCCGIVLLVRLYIITFVTIRQRIQGNMILQIANQNTAIYAQLI